jgi:hypothetical protein
MGYPSIPIDDDFKAVVCCEDAYGCFEQIAAKIKNSWSTLI